MVDRCEGLGCGVIQGGIIYHIILYRQIVWNHVVHLTPLGIPHTQACHSRHNIYRTWHITHQPAYITISRFMHRRMNDATVPCTRIKYCVVRPFSYFRFQSLDFERRRRRRRRHDDDDDDDNNNHNHKSTLYWIPLRTTYRSNIRPDHQFKSPESRAGKWPYRGSSCFSWLPRAIDVPHTVSHPVPHPVPYPQFGSQ